MVTPHRNWFTELFHGRLNILPNNWVNYAWNCCKLFRCYCIQVCLHISAALVRLKFGYCDLQLQHCSISLQLLLLSIHSLSSRQRKSHDCSLSRDCPISYPASELIWIKVELFHLILFRFHFRFRLLIFDWLSPELFLSSPRNSFCSVLS